MVGLATVARALVQGGERAVAAGEGEREAQREGGAFTLFLLRLQWVHHTYIYSP